MVMQLPEKKVPRTIENTREFDETVCKPDDEEVLNFVLCHLEIITVFLLLYIGLD